LAPFSRAFLLANRKEIRLLTRVTDHRRVATLHFTAESLGGRSGRCKLTFLDPEHVPDFAGDQAWFELERVSAKPWPFWRAVRAVEPPPGWAPAERAKPTPAQLLGHRS